MDQEEEEEEYYHYRLNDCRFGPPKPDWFTSLVLVQAGLVHDALSFLFSPAVLFIALLSRSYREAEATAEAVRSAVAGAPSAAAVVLRRLALGALGAAYACVVLSVVLGLAVVLGVGLVQVWVDEPVVVKENIHLDYSEANPRAVFWFQRRPTGQKRVPIGHTFSVSVELLMPESGFNRAIGVFQISVELISTNGYVTAKSSLPCMLRYRSFPIRLARTFIMSVPLVLGLTGETQKISVNRILRHKESYSLRTEAVRVTVVPRAGTESPPQIYEAKMVIRSKLPWHKELVRRWKWTFSVWSSMYIFVFLVAALLYFCRPLFFPFALLSVRSSIEEEEEEDEDEDEDEAYVAECLRKWRLRRSERIMAISSGDQEETVGSPAASALTRDHHDEVEALEEEEFDDDDDDDDGDSGSVC